MWRTQWDQENWSVICKIRRIHMTNTWYASDWDQAYCPSYAKICRTVVRHIQVHLYTYINLCKWTKVVCGWMLYFVCFCHYYYYYCANTTSHPPSLYPSLSPTPGPVVTCPENEFLCKDGRCLDPRRRCNGQRDCADGDDEENCGKSHFSPLFPKTIFCLTQDSLTLFSSSLFQKVYVCHRVLADMCQGVFLAPWFTKTTYFFCQNFLKILILSIYFKKFNS